MKGKVGILVFLALTNFCLYAQYGTGLLLDDSAYQAVPSQPNYGVKASDDSIYKVDLSPYCPKVANQGPYSTCTGWALAYGALSIQHAIAAGWEGQQEKITRHAYSAYFLYNQLKTEGDCQEGTAMTDALELMKNTGNVLSADFDSLGCSHRPDSGDFYIAQKHRIKAYRKLFKKDAESRKKIHAIKQSLINHKPVAIGIQPRENFMDLAGRQWWFPDIGNSPYSLMAHALVVVGFDDGKGSYGGAFQLMNSFGSNWGDHGFCWVNYEDLAKYCLYAFQLSIDTEATEKVDLYGRISCYKITLAGDTIEKSNIQSIYHSKSYHLNTRTWQTGDLFQLEISKVAPERYLYVFSRDAAGKVQLHWPRDERLDQQFQGKHESAIIISPHITLTLPESHTVFELEKVGTEQFCLLFSPSPMADINEKLKEISSSGSPFKQAVYQSLGEQLISAKRIVYLKKSMGFWASSKYSQKLIPVFIQMRVHSQ